MHRFFGVNPAEADSLVQNHQWERNKKAFLGIGDEQPGQRPKAPQSEEDAMNVFFGVEAPKNQAGKSLTRGSPPQPAAAAPQTLTVSQNSSARPFPGTVE